MMNKDKLSIAAWRVREKWNECHGISLLNSYPHERRVDIELLHLTNCIIMMNKDTLSIGTWPLTRKEKVSERDIEFHDILSPPSILTNMRAGRYIELLHLTNCIIMMNKDKLLIRAKPNLKCSLRKRA